jgi:hypothetical protein
MAITALFDLSLRQRGRNFFPAPGTIIQMEEWLREKK